MCVSAATFGLGSLSVALEVYRARVFCVAIERLSLLNVEVVEIFSMLMHDNFLLLFPRRPQVRNMYVCVQLT